MNDFQQDFTTYQGIQPVGHDLHMENCKKLSRLSHLIQDVGLADLQEGKRRFTKFVENGHKWTKDDYEHNGFRAEYCERLFVIRAGLVIKVLSYCQRNMCFPDLLINSSGRPRSLKVASFGCGPSGELAGLETYFSHLKVQRKEMIQADHKANKISQEEYSSLITSIQSAKLETVTGYDSSTGWRKYSESLGYSFVHQCIDQKFVEEMEPLDVLIMSYFAHNADFSKPIVPSRHVRNHHTGTTDYMRKWDILQQKVKMIIVIDISSTSKETLEALNSRNFVCINGVTDDKGRDVIARIWYRRDQW